MEWITAHGVVAKLSYVPKMPVLEIGTTFKDYTSEAALVTDKGTGTQPYLMYDNEAGKTWPTPANEQQAPIRYMQLFCQLAHSVGKRAMCTPGLDLANAIPGGNTWPDNQTWYTKTSIAWHGARDSEALQVQTQSLIPLGAPAFYDFMHKSYTQARAANPFCVAGAGLSTKRGSTDANVQCFAYTVGRLQVKRWWLNVPGPDPDYASASDIMRKCEQIAVNLGL
jgi:hypothetical protein